MIKCCFSLGPRKKWNMKISADLKAKSCLMWVGQMPVICSAFKGNYFPVRLIEPVVTIYGKFNYRYLFFADS